MKSLLFAFFLIIYSQFSSSAGMQSQLDVIFLEMENHTSAGKYETMRRSAYYGSRYTYKTQIFNENLVSMRLPSARGGCGGIDVFGGSFSYINSDQLVQLLRQIGANAKGYAFQLALDNMCPDCMKWMNELQTKMQSLNENLSNSCQLAQGLINDVTNIAPLKIKEKTQHSITASLQGIGEDFVDLAEHISTPETAVKRLFDADPAKFNEDTGSVVYRALKKHNAKSWFTNGDNELIETIQSMTGTIVVGDLVTGRNNNGETTQIWALAGNKLSIADYINGINNVSIYNCSADTKTDNCRITPSNTKTINLVGLKPQILESLIGSNGLISYISLRNYGATLSPQNQSILSAMPFAIGSKVYELASLSPEAAEQFITKYIDAISLEYVYRLLNQAYKAVDVAMSNFDSVYKQKAMNMILTSKKELNDEYTQLAAQFVSLKDVDAHYNEILKNIEKLDYIDPTQKGSSY